LKPADGRVLFHAVPKEAPGLDDPMPDVMPNASKH